MKDTTSLKKVLYDAIDKTVDKMFTEKTNAAETEIEITSKSGDKIVCILTLEFKESKEETKECNQQEEDLHQN